MLQWLLKSVSIAEFQLFNEAALFFNTTNHTNPQHTSVLLPAAKVYHILILNKLFIFCFQVAEELYHGLLWQYNLCYG